MKKVIIILILLVIPRIALATYNSAECVQLQYYNSVVGTATAPMTVYTYIANIEAGTLSYQVTHDYTGDYTYTRPRIMYFENGVWNIHTQSAGYVQIEGAHFSEPLPDSCPTCVDEEAQADIDCGANNWVYTNEEECQISCLSCSGVGEKTESELSDECGGSEEILFYDLDTCSGACKGACDPGDLTNAEEACGVLGLDKTTWSNVSCDGYCNGCTTDHIQTATNDCASAGGTIVENSYSCKATSANGVQLSYRCEGPNSVIEPDNNGDLEIPDTGTAEESPTEQPNGATAENPENDNPETNENIESEYLKGIKANTDTLITNSNNTNELLGNIAENLVTSVGNQGILNDSIQALDNSEIESILNQIYRELLEDEDEETDEYGTPEVDVTDWANDGSLLDEELATLGENINEIITDINEIVGVDLNGSTGLPVWILPTPFGDFTIDLDDYQFVFDTCGNVVLFAAYLMAVMIIFG